MSLPPRHLIAACWLACSAASQAAPFVPASDAEILEVLPNSMIGERPGRAAPPRDLPTALARAREYIERTRAYADPRFLGYAQATLAPWWEDPAAPVEALVLRAIVKQSLHDFAGALADLDRALIRAPDHPQALLTRATVLQVTGRLDEARRDCAHLLPAARLVAVACLSRVASLNGRAGPAYGLLSAEHARAAGTTSPGVELWLLTQLAETAAQLGNGAEARDHFRAALALNRPDSYLFAAYADFLLDQNEPAAVVALLKGQTQADNLLLRLTLAEARLGLPQARAHTRELGERFAAARARGDRTHLREEARYRLQLRRDSSAALKLALENWRTQREPTDARLVLEAALAAGQPQAARPVLDWLQRTRIQDATLTPLARRLRGIS